MTAVPEESNTRLSFEDVAVMNREMQDSSAAELIEWALGRWGDDLVTASSFGAEDVVLVHLLSELDRNARIFTIDTGRLPQETYDVMDRLRHRYGIEFEVYFPDATQIQAMVRKKGPNSFYESIDNRKECCRIRKLEPLARALDSSRAWITGLRRDQSVTRAEIPRVQLDLSNGGIVKLNPLAAWSEDDVWTFIREHNVPYNTLHDCGYPSIGCAPCTRAIKPGENIRAGRWWWEDPATRECGLHARASTDSSKL